MRLLLSKIQTRVPEPIRKIGQTIYGAIPLNFRYGRTFREASALLNQSQYWSREQLEDYQCKVLKELITHAYKNVPFYRKLYISNGIHPNDISKLSDIIDIPMISKEDVRSHSDEFKAENLSRSKFQYHTTGGSTGKPLGLYWEADRTVPLERAFMQRQWRWAGFEMEKDRSIIFRGIPIRGGTVYSCIELRQSTIQLLRV